MNKNINFTVDFMGIGSPKCGTEWIAACLREHPQINFSKHKEVNYFLSPTEGVTNFVYKNIRVKSPHEYENEFALNTPEKIKGEYNNHYIFDEHALRKVKKNFPDIKLILAIRDPVKYLYSIYWYMKFSNAYDLIPGDFEKALKEAGPDDLYEINHAKFGALIERCLHIFEEKHLHVIVLDDIKNSPELVVKNMYEYLGIDSNFKPTCLSEHINPTKVIRYPMLMKYIRGVMSIIERVHLGGVLNFLLNTNTPIRFLYKSFFHKNQSYPPLSKDTENRLRQELAPDISKLELLLKRDLSAWKKSV